MKPHSNENKVCFPLEINDWQPEVSAPGKAAAVAALENGKVIYLPRLAFALSAEEQTYLRLDAVDPKTKSVKYSGAKKRLWGASEKDNNSPVLAAMLQRYSDYAAGLINALFPGYTDSLVMGNTSFRPVAAEGRVQSKRHDDRLLHVDAFPSRPSGGERLLRVFCNINPNGEARIWRVGDSFENVAKHFLPEISKPIPGSAKLLKFLKITKRLRTPYDHYMLALHDKMKFDSEYQASASQETVAFAAGSSWIVFSDQVSHAAMSGCHMLEQTFTLPVGALSRPATSPLQVLEKLLAARLV